MVEGLTYIEARHPMVAYTQFPSLFSYAGA